MLRTHWEQGKVRGGGGRGGGGGGGGGGAGGGGGGRGAAPHPNPKKSFPPTVEGMDLTKEAAHHIHW
jgi:hypothetical protein